jgi:hypothetical protein
MRVQLVTRARRAAAKRPWIVWTVAAGLAVGVAASVHGALGELDEQRARWGASREVWVAGNVLEAGDPVAGRIDRRSVPLPAVPSGALEVDGGLSEATVATQTIGVGEIVTTHDVSAPDGNATLAPQGWVTVAVREPIATGAATGGRVAVSADGVLLAAEGVVVGSRDDAVLVAVPASDGPAVAAAATESRAALLVKD